MKSKTFNRRTIFIGSSISVGSSEITYDNELHFKKGFKKPIPVLRSKELLKHSYIELPEYNPITGEMADNTWRIYFFDLKNVDEFSFKNSTSQEMILKLKFQESKINEQSNMIEQLLKAMNIDSIEDFKRQYIQNAVDIYKKTIGYGNSSPIQNTQSK